MRRSLIAVLACSAATLVGCSAPPDPEVTFYGDGETVSASPQVYCRADAECFRDDSRVVELSLRPGRSVVQISVPSDIAEQPWGVIYSYLDRDGVRVDASSRIHFPKDGQVAYTLELPSPEDRLLLANVTRLSVVAGKLEPSGLWTLRATE